jgi:hypothetical protein
MLSDYYFFKHIFQLILFHHTHAHKMNDIDDFKYMVILMFIFKNIQPSYLFI